MQIVSRHILEDLVRQKAVFEDDSHETSTFSEILSEMRKFIDKGKKLSYPGYLIPWKPYECVEDEIHYAHEMVLKKFLKGNSMVKYVGAGSSRTAFALAGGKCLKIANSKKGVAQNKQEVLNS